MTLTAVVKVTIIWFLSGLLNCIRADLFMDNALYNSVVVLYNKKYKNTNGIKKCL